MERERNQFLSLGVSKWIVDQLNTMSISSPTSVQTACIPPSLSGRDVLASSRTGTGKTLSFAIPILQSIGSDPFGIHSLVVTPTRELAVQIADQFRYLGAPLNLRISLLIGGLSMQDQSASLSLRPHVVIATPGRIADHIRSTSGLSFKRLKYFVLDEADRLLNESFVDALSAVFEAIPTARQTLVYTATLSGSVERLIEVAKGDPFLWQQQETGSDTSVATVAGLEQKYILTPAIVKDAYLVHILDKLREEHPDHSVLIFTKSCRQCHVIHLMLRQFNFSCVPLHSLLPQRERLNSLSRFKAGSARVLVATDVASRGLDIPAVHLVVNHNVPRVAKDYVHRVGRTARAGRPGYAVSLVTQYDVALVLAIEQYVGVKLKEVNVDEAVLEHVVEVNVARREADIKWNQLDLFKRRDVYREIDGERGEHGFRIGDRGYRKPVKSNEKIVGKMGKSMKNYSNNKSNRGVGTINSSRIVGKPTKDNTSSRTISKQRARRRLKDKLGLSSKGRRKNWNYL